MQQESVIDKSIVLSLNALWQAISIETPRRAIEDMTSLSVFGDAPKMGVDILLEDDGESIAYCRPVEWEEWLTLPIRPKDLIIQTHRFAIRCPIVVICCHYNRMPLRTPYLSSSSIFERDGYRCQYCGHVFPRKQLNLDHVIPESLGGRTTWENIVCSCVSCNTRKANRLPREAGMRLIKKPVMPKPRPVTFDFCIAGHPTWRPFLHL